MKLPARQNVPCQLSAAPWPPPGQQLLKLGGLVFQSLQLAGIGNLHATELRLVFVESLFGYPVLAPVLGPFSCSFNIPMICSSVNRECFMLSASSE